MISVLAGCGYALDDLNAVGVSDGKSIAIFLEHPPAGGNGFLIYRKPASLVAGEYELLTQNGPIKPINDPDEAQSLIGPEWDFVARAVERDEPFAVLRKLHSDRYLGGVLSLLSAGVATVTGRWYKDGHVDPGQTYSYKIAAVDASGSETDHHIIEVAAIPNMPAPPRNLIGQGEDRMVNLAWDYPEWKQHTGDFVTQFVVYRRMPDGRYERINQRPLLRNDSYPRGYSDHWLTNDSVYSYYVAAIDIIGNISPPSNTIEIAPVDLTPPKMPRNITVTPSESSLVITWDRNTEFDVAGYNVYRATGLGDNFPKVRINDPLVSCDRPVYVDPDVNHRTAYFYSISAIDNSGNEGLKSSAVSGMVQDDTAPPRPTIVDYSLDRGFLKLIWNQSPAQDLLGYNLYRGENERIHPRINEMPILDTMVADSGYQGMGLTPGKEFLFGISAVDSSYNESKRAILRITVPDEEPPLPPLNFTVANPGGRAIEIRCEASPSLDVNEYRLFKSTGDKADTMIATRQSVPLVINDSVVVKGRRYSYFAVAVDSNGNISEPTQKITVTFKDHTPPSSPRNATARLLASGIALNWERVADDDIAGYNIYRADIPNGQYLKLNDVPVPELRYQDSDGKEWHFYIIRAVDSSGNESAGGVNVSAG